MKLTAERIENGLVICEYEENGEIKKKEIPLSDIPFEITEGNVFTETDNNGTFVYERTDANDKETAETQKRVRAKLNKLFGRK